MREKNPESLKSRMYELAFKAWDFKQALKLAQAGIRSYPADFEFWLIQATCQQRLWNLDLSIQSYKKVIELNSNEAQAHLGLASIYKYRKQFNDSIRHGQKALEINPANVTALYFLAEASLESGQFAESLHYTNQLAQINPHFADAMAMIQEAKTAPPDEQKRLRDAARLLLIQSHKTGYG